MKLQHTGFGLRQPHVEQALALAQPGQAGAFVEVHSENYFADGGASLQVLQAARERWDLSLHGVGLALGSAAGVDESHLERLARLVQRSDPVRVSDHASFARAPRHSGGPVLHGADLLPLAFTDAALHILVANVQRVQERLRRPILVENLSAYLCWTDGSLAEPKFINELARRSGCGLLLDVNNLMVNALNAQAGDVERALAECRAWIDQVEPGIVGEIHLAGYHDSGELVIDDHGSRVHAPVWRAFDHALQRLGARPTLIEWDTQLPSFEVLCGEVALAEAAVQRALAAPSTAAAKEAA